MAHCHHDISPVLDPFILLVDMFLNGVAGSFTHCIMMCGPIAAAQVGIRVMNIPANKMSEKEKFKAATILPYYFGKATTYSLVGLIFLLFKESLKDVVILKYAAALLLLFTAIYFLLNSMNHPDIFNKLTKFTLINRLNKFLVNRSQRLKPYGRQGFMLGMILGLLPCGLVMAMVITAVSSSNNPLVVMSAMFIFGIATIPGLFMVSYLGNTVISKFKKYYQWLYSIVMFFNCYLMIGYALQLL